MSSALPTSDNDYQAPPPPARYVFDRAAYNAVLGSVGARLRALEAKRNELQAVIDDLRLFGLQRLDTAIVPLIDQTQAQLEDMQAQVAATLVQANQIIIDFQAVTAVNLTALRDAVDAAEAKLASVEAQIALILAGGIAADKVVEDAARVFVTPAERAEIGQLRLDLMALEPASSFVAIASAASPHAAVVRGRVRADTSGGPITVNAPAGMAAGDWIEVTRAGANALTVGRATYTIEGAAEDLVIDKDKASVRLTHDGTTLRVSVQRAA